MPHSGPQWEQAAVSQIVVKARLALRCAGRPAWLCVSKVTARAAKA